MKIKTLTAVTAAALAVALAGCATKQPQQHSGYLGDYSQMQETKDANGNPVARTINPNFNPKNYNAVLIEPVRFYPEPQPSDKLSTADLDAIRSYINLSLYKELGKTVKLVDRAGPGVLRLNVAITSVGTEKAGLKPYQYIPIAFVVTMAKDAATGKPEEAKIFVESEVSDSVTGVRMMSAVRSGAGKSFTPSPSASVVDSLKPLIDEWIKGAAADAPKMVQG